jgi:dethiobiotin synthetase
VTRACFVTATDTGVGKTILSATIAAGLLADGVDVRVRKPVLTGAAEPPSHRRPPITHDLSQLPDHELLGAVSGEQPEDVSTARYEAPVAPPLAAELAGRPLELETILDSLRAAAAGAGAIVVEGIGGLLVPLAASWDVRRLAQELDWPVIVAARCGLGTINHTLLTLEAARHAGLDVRAVVLTPWPAAPDAVARSNRDLIARLGEVEVATLPALSAITRATLREASAALAYEPWLAAA